jgi:hypothetical protein
MPVTAEDRNTALQVHRYQAYVECGITPEVLARHAIEELSAYHEEEHWVTGDVGDCDSGTPSSPSGWVAVKRWKDWPTRQRARIDLQKMADMYPTQRHAIEESITVQIVGEALGDPLMELPDIGEKPSNIIDIVSCDSIDIDTDSEDGCPDDGSYPFERLEYGPTT